MNAVSCSTKILAAALVLTGAVYASSGEPARTSARMNCGARVACITPDGLPARMAPAEQDKHAAVLIMDDDSISCPLNSGETTFVVALPANGVERLKFVNENATARGTLRIAVANEELSPNSPLWLAVDGQTAFQNKRHFDVSMVGVEARFVRVTFAVERAGLTAEGGAESSKSLPMDESILGSGLANVGARSLVAATQR